MKPIIGISAFYNGELGVYKANSEYIVAVEQAGGVPLLIPAMSNGAHVSAILECIDGLLVPGGPDVAPLLYGEEPATNIGPTCQGNDIFEMALIRGAREAGKPILGICRGLQIINVTFGGTLWQHIADAPGTKICHRQDRNFRSELTHTVSVEADSMLERVVGKREILVNTFHHQVAKKVAPGFTVCATSKGDGLIEGIESEDGILAVQWHPECLSPLYDDHARLFADLVARCKK